MAVRKLIVTGGSIIPQTDWEQTDETQRDFLKNKPQLGALAYKDELEIADLASDAIQIIQESIDKNTDAIDAMKNGESLDSFGDVEEEIASLNGEITDLQDADTAIDDRVKAIEDDYLKESHRATLDVKIDTEIERAQAAEESLQSQINTIVDNPDAEGIINSIKEFTEYIEEHGSVADGFREDINENKSAINTLNAVITEKANKADIARTVSLGSSTQENTYYKIDGFGNWGGGAWYNKSFSMLITSRAGETVWVSVSADDTNTDARALRIMTTHDKIHRIYYRVSDNAIYVFAKGWCNNICSHILSNISGDYVPTITSVTGIPEDAVDIPIVEFGVTSGNKLRMSGSADRPTYNNSEIALLSDVTTAIADKVTADQAASIANQAVAAQATETWTFTLENGTSTTKKVVVKP